MRSKDPSTYIVTNVKGHALVVTHASDDTTMFDESDALWLRQRIRHGKEIDAMELETYQTGDIDPMVAVLHRERLRVGMERVDISRTLGMQSSEVIRQYEEGKILPRLESLRAWAYILNHKPIMVSRG